MFVEVYSNIFSANVGLLLVIVRAAESLKGSRVREARRKFVAN